MRTIIILIFLSISFPFKSWAWEFTEPCQSAINKLNAFILSAPNTCNSSNDCDNAYIKGHSCFGAVVMAKSTLNDPEFNASLLHSQKIMREACTKEWEENPLPACSPDLIPVECYHGKCIDARERAD